MEEGHFEREEKISRKQAERLILDLANYSDWQYKPGSNDPFRRFSSLADLEYFCRNEIHESEEEDYEDIGLSRIAERSRVWRRPVTLFENQFQAHSWSAGGTAQGSVSVPDLTTGGWTTLTGEGLLVSSDYQAKFSDAFDKLEAALKRSNYTSLEQALATGVSSVESYITHRSYIWNLSNQNERLVDDKNHKVSFDDKVDRWIPKMSGGRHFDKSGRTWQDFQLIMHIRDKGAIHAKQTSFAISSPQFAAMANRFTLGIAGILFEMHKHFGEMTPANIIKASYAPNVVRISESA